jgi:sulfite reductase alpha subunit-like flavoprotein
MADELAIVERFWWVSSLLREFPKVKGKISIAALVTALGKQFPRLYSIASSARVSPWVVEVVVGLVSVGRHQGLASGGLHRLRQGCPVWVSTRDSSFRLPDSTEAPLIMAGAGTGVAPFLAFVQERAHLLGEASLPGGPARGAGQALLFTGFRRREEAVSPEVFEDALAESALTSYSVSLTRDPQVERRTLMDAMRTDAHGVWEALQHPECHYYFCGYGSTADSAYEALVSAAVVSSGMSRVKAINAIDKMRREGRYHLDVWGAVSHGAARVVKQQKKSNLAKKWLRTAKLSPSAYGSFPEVD